MKKTPTYHHGDLREALLSSAEALLRRDGLGGLTLRAAAREAGVSHAAPAHHFGDLRGLLTALAAVGFARLGDSLHLAVSAPGAKRWDGSRAYVRFAADNAALFQLMFRSDRLDAADARLRDTRLRALMFLAESRSVEMEAPTVGQWGKVLAGWSLVHGYSLLLLDGRLKGILHMAPPATSTEDLLEAMLLAVDRNELGPSASPGAVLKKKRGS